MVRIPRNHIAVHRRVRNCTNLGVVQQTSLTFALREQDTYLLHYVTNLRVVERIPRSHVVVSVVISKYVETRVFIFIKSSTVVVNSTADSAATLWVARDRTSLLAFHDGESRDDK